MSDPSISIVVPFYNADDTISATLESVVRQSFSNFEVIVIDDGSQNEAVEIISKWRKENESYLQEKSIELFCYRFNNAGPSVARNRGIERSRGKYIAFLDADDHWSIDKLQAQFLFLEQNPTVGLVYSFTHCVDAQNNFFRPGSLRSPGVGASLELLMQNYLDNGSSPMVRRSVLAEIGNFPTQLRLAEDWDLWLRIAECYPIAAIPVPQVNYQVSRYSSSANTQHLGRDSRKTIERALRRRKVSSQMENQRNFIRVARARSLANLYEFLYFQTFSGAIRRRNIPRAFLYLFQALKYDSALRKDWKMVGRAIAKVICLSLLPNRVAQKVLNILGKANTVHSEMLSYIDTDVKGRT
ncbi:MAG: glycosyltransferase family A protein [Cyanobacteria bacterium P01_C01_bin.89]